MSPRKKRRKEASPGPRARNNHGRQRQRLIDACISALHIYGPSRTTVEKVVAIAKMSPGIVRFYFNSKAEMLVASLQFLAAEFDERLLVPVSKLKSTPVAALELMVDLYLDPDIASPRKVSVWYAFWGEASSRQEYYDICGQKDESFAALVRELVESLIVETSQPQLDPDGIALGLIGVLEMLWQDFAFRSEPEIDRPAAKRRCMAYLRSIFPGRFPEAGVRAWPVKPQAAGPGRALGHPDARQHALERERLLHGAWTAVGHESQVSQAGEFLAVDIGVERVLVVRDAAGRLHALRNSCPESPHALTMEPSGRLEIIECKLHGLRFSLDGRRTNGSGREDLSVLALSSLGGLMFVRSPSHDRPAVPAALQAWFDAEPNGLRVLIPAADLAVAADWKVVVELWLDWLGHESALGRAPGVAQGRMDEVLAWEGVLPPADGWSARRYRKLVPDAVRAWRRLFIAPNQLLEIRPDGLSMIQAISSAPQCCRVRRLDYTRLAPDAVARAALQLARRMAPYARRVMLDAAESIQQGIVEFGYEWPAAPRSCAVAWFRNRLQARLAVGG
jgi:TetR/AcrR family transcriptional repressor of bet genes